jgi:hypothetical protein
MRKMAYLRQLSSHFDLVYLKPANLSRAITVLSTNPPAQQLPEQQQLVRRQQDRRCGIDRRSQQRPILLDTRSPHSRRKQRRRQQDAPLHEESRAGIDVYA